MANDVTSDQISALRHEAKDAGDLAMVSICNLALAGSQSARVECARVIDAARAMEDPDDGE